MAFFVIVYINIFKKIIFSIGPVSRGSSRQLTRSTLHQVEPCSNS